MLNETFSVIFKHCDLGSLLSSSHIVRVLLSVSAVLWL